MRSIFVSMNKLTAQLSTAAFLFAVISMTVTGSYAQKIKQPKPVETTNSVQQAIEKTTIPSLPQENENSEQALPSGGETDATTVASNYVFATTTTGSLTDMSSGTTTLVAADQDDTASAVTNIGFDFYFQSARYTQFSVNSNGTIRLGATAVSTTLYDPLGQAGQALITAYGADQRTHAGNGKVHFKVSGAVGSRVLVIEWLNIQADFNSGGTADLTYQVRLYETTGVIEFVYGSATMSTAGAADANSNSPQIGFSSNNVVGTVGSLTAAQSGTPAPTYNSGAATPVNNTYVAGTIPVLTSAADGARRTFSFTPPTPTTASNLTFAALAPTSYTLNWVDAPDEQLYSIFRSTDGVNYTFFATTAQNITTLNVTGLNPSTTYFWQVFSVSEGAVNTVALTGSQATPAAGEDTCNGAGGLWSAPGTWADNSVPTVNDNVTIGAGCTVTIDIASNALNLTVQNGGILQYETTTARTLTIGAAVTINTGGTFQSAATGTVTTHVLSVGTDLTNNGTLDFSTNTNTAGAGITFTGAANNTFGGTGATTDVLTINVNKGTTNANILELSTSNFTVQGVTTDVAGFLTLTNGTFRIAGAFTVTNRVFTAAAYTIGATTGFWLNNPNFTVAGQNGSPTESGLLRITQGTFNIGTATGNSMGFSTGSTIIVEGGAVNATSRFGVAAAANTITYTQTAGTVTVNTIGNASATLGSFDVGTGLGSSITISGGTIVVQLAATIDYRDQAGSGITGVTGGTLQLGNANSGAAKAFSIRGVVPNLLLTNTSANHTASWSTTLVNYNNISRNITISAGTTLNLGNVTFLFYGTTITNNGTLTHTGASSNTVIFTDYAPVNYTGTGTVTAPLTNLSLQPVTSFTIDPASPNIVTAAVRLFSGNVVNSNKLTVGNGGATSAIVQIGNTTTPTAAGTFDQPVTFNLGTGGESISYLRTTASRTTGGEVNPTRVLTALTYDDSDVTHTLTIAGGDLTVTTTTLTNGRVITGANNYIVPSAGTVARTAGYIDGNLNKAYAAIASKTFETGTANGYSPATVNVTSAGTFPLSFLVKAVQAPQPSVNAATSLQRYWTVTPSGGAPVANLTFNYLQIDVTGNEANYRLTRVSGGVPTLYGLGVAPVNTTANTVTINSVDQFSDWTLSELGTTAAQVSLSGRVTSGKGGIANARITLTDSHGVSRSVLTNSFGSYRFDKVNSGETYIIGAAAKGYTFSQPNQAITVNDSLTGINFSGSR